LRERGVLAICCGRIFKRRDRHSKLCAWFKPVTVCGVYLLYLALLVSTAAAREGYLKVRRSFQAVLALAFGWAGVKMLLASWWTV
jgi:threonine/homoserine/homoserine lactone efflux protein